MAKNHKKLNRIKAVLADQDRTQIWLSEKMEKTTVTVSRWCSNTKQPSLETLFEIAKVLEVDVCELLAKKSTKND